MLMTSSQPLPNQLAKIKVRKKTAQKHHPPFKMFKISANTAPLVGGGLRYIFMPESSLLYGFLLIDLYLLRSYNFTVPLTFFMSSAISLASVPL